MRTKTLQNEQWILGSDGKFKIEVSHAIIYLKIQHFDKGSMKIKVDIIWLLDPLFFGEHPPSTRKIVGE